jgi:mevalonate kinase
MARSNGKVILLGEHAVVYGVPAIAAGIGVGAEAVARGAAGAVASITLGDRTAKAGDGTELGLAFEALLAALDAPPLAVQATLELPPGCGLGASAAIGVAVARAVLDSLEPAAVGPEPAKTTDRVLRAAGAWERVFHGNPSGIDAAAAALGGVLRFRRDQGWAAVPLGEPLSLAIAIAGPPASTRRMVESVAELRRAQPALVEETLRTIAELVDAASDHLVAGELDALGRTLDRNHELLVGLGVSTPAIERAVTRARQTGALGAKLTGSGGGGAVIALVRDPTPVLEAWRGDGMACLSTTIDPGIGGPSPPLPVR